MKKRKRKKYEEISAYIRAYNTYIYIYILSVRFLIYRFCMESHELSDWKVIEKNLGPVLSDMFTLTSRTINNNKVHL
jgi:hypothetical protein